MIIKKKQITCFNDFHETFEYDPENSLFFDIETTGLSAASASVFLIGTIHMENNTWMLTQYLCETPEDEPEMLRRFYEHASAFSTLIHFNGSTFDIPFLDKRSAHFGLNKVFRGLCEKLSIDLYQKLRRLRKLLALERTNQKTLEAAAGWQREDELTGKHMTALYKNYTKTHDAEIQRLLLLHNHDDLIGMTEILKLVSYLQLCSGQISEIRPDASGAAVGGEPEKTPVLLIRFRIPDALPAPLHLQLENVYTLSVDGACGRLFLSGYAGSLKYFFSDYKNYFYLPLEDQAIHKSVAFSVEKEFRVPAKKETCYTRKSGVFFPQPEPCIVPCFKENYRDSTSYFEYDSLQAADTDKLSGLVSAILRSIIRL